MRDKKSAIFEILDYDVGPLRESLEECAIQLHHYTPQDEIDKGIFCLFAKSNPKELFEALRENNPNNNKNNSNVQLVDLYDKCKCLVLNMSVMDFSSLQKNNYSFYLLLESADEIYELPSQEVSQKLLNLKNGIDPHRLFQSSFRLLEEKWRKSCRPNLVKIENKLISTRK
ncbi:hypothetical protein Glove_233g45 [Diversispora epigaea]|uniref:Uncharacterized protein n=1 Tax=Diversispora epigaea TaxID=1348612 RepID=A0A397IE18_9GLOM|nr:hypothetical protein Glove_233g45 [Diversispora epigaea]